VNDANIPASGGRIKCPSCQNSFVVYPEAPKPEPVAPVSGFDEDKTSVASLPDLQALRSAAQAAAAKPQPEEELGGATEVMGGDALPNFASLFGQKPSASQNDGTVEMQNPLAFAAAWQAGRAVADDDDDPAGAGATEVISSDMVFNAQVFGRQGALKKDSAAQAPAPVQQPAWTPPVAKPPQPQAQPQAPAPPAWKPPEAKQAGPSLSSALFDDMTGEVASPLDLGGPSGPLPPAQAPSVQQAAPPPQPAPSNGVDPNHDGPWKLKTNFGLTYEFPDTKSLLGWMSSRDELDGYTLSADGVAFLPIQEFPQVMMRNKRSGATQAMRPVPSAPTAPATDPGFGPGPGFPPPMAPAQSSQPSKVIKPPPQLQSRDAGATKVLWGVFILLIPIVLVLGLQLTGVVNFKAMVGLEAPSAPVQPTPPVAKEPAPEVKPDEAKPVVAELTAEQKAQVDALVEDARIALKNNKLPDAREKLETAKLIDPKRFEVYDLQAEVFDKIGEKDKAQAIRQEVQKLRSEASAQPKDSLEESPEAMP
jgi:hypothetical protein